MSRLIAWHFTGKTLRDGRPLPAVGEWLTHDGPVVMCESGLHASIKALDALQYAPGNMAHLVECEDVVKTGGDKLVCRRRKILASVDVTEVLHAFARRQALSVVRLWDAPEVVVHYLKTGDELLRAAAGAAARSAAADAAWAAADAAWAAAWAAARAAARDAARDAAWDAAWDAADAAAAAAGAAAARDLEAHLLYAMGSRHPEVVEATRG